MTVALGGIMFIYLVLFVLCTIISLYYDEKLRIPLVMLFFLIVGWYAIDSLAEFTVLLVIMALFGGELE